MAGAWRGYPGVWREDDRSAIDRCSDRDMRTAEKRSCSLQSTVRRQGTVSRLAPRVRGVGACGSALDRSLPNSGGGEEVCREHGRHGTWMVGGCPVTGTGLGTNRLPEGVRRWWLGVSAYVSDGRYCGGIVKYCGPFRPG